MTPRLNAATATLVLALLCGAASGASDCAAGKFRATDATGKDCTNCPVGTFAAAKAETCTKCAAGKSVAAGVGTVEDGTVEGGTVESGCTACVAGKFAAAGAACANCAVGKFSLAEATTCTDCAATAAGTATTVAAGAGKKAGDCAVDAATAKDIADKAKAKAVYDD